MRRPSCIGLPEEGAQIMCVDNIRCNGLMMNAFEENSKVTVPQMINPLAASQPVSPSLPMFIHLTHIRTQLPPVSETTVSMLLQVHVPGNSTQQYLASKMPHSFMHTTTNPKADLTKPALDGLTYCQPAAT
ncbi:Hypothetical predicted protein [Marmota monax]|uniref:Uncharacterized protein n=1 Tax=Marmota monax TaxID=9995 RepID=A0A5E4AX32_MARMO|nr:Hypothetical predicted protein [Marmota monax]